MKLEELVAMLESIPRAPQHDECLSDRLRALADRGHPRAAELRQAADDDDGAFREWWETEPADEATSDRRMRAKLATFARARLLWCEVTGEPLF